MVAAIDESNRPMPTPRAGRSQADIKREKRAGERDLNQNCATSRISVDWPRPMIIGGSALPIMISERRDGRDQQLVEGALFALARHRQAREQQRLQNVSGADQRGNHVPARLELRVVPGRGLHGSPAAAAGAARSRY